MSGRHPGDYYATPLPVIETARDLLPPDIGLTLDPAAGPAGELPGGLDRPVDDRRDLVERHREHVVQHERQPLVGLEGVEHDQHRQPDLVPGNGLVLGLLVSGDGLTLIYISIGTSAVSSARATVSALCSRPGSSHWRRREVCSRPAPRCCSSHRGPSLPT